MPLTPPPHPLRHLSSVSAEGLRVRAAIWRDAGHHDPDDAVKSLLLVAAADIEAAGATFATLAAADRGTLREDRAAVAAMVAGTLVASDPAALRAAASALRIQGLPDDSGSTAEHLESAADLIGRDLAALADLEAAVSGESFDADLVADIADRARGGGPDPTHEAPRPRM